MISISRPPSRSRRPSSISTTWPRRAIPKAGCEPLTEALTGAIKMAEAAVLREGHVTGVTTGLADLDKKLGGLQPSDLVILAAPALHGQDLAGHQHRLQRGPGL